MKKQALAVSILAMGLSMPASAQAEPVAFQTLNREGAPLSRGCRSLAVQPTENPAPTGFYNVDLGNGTLAVVYCENRVVYNGLKGGWTLMWSNLRGGRGKLTSDMHWGASIETLPRYRGSVALLNSAPDLQSFEVYTGLRWWRSIMDGPDGRRELMYEWAADYSDQRQVHQRAACGFDLNPTRNWTITFNVASCQQLTGTALPGMINSTNGMQWSTADRDHDTYPQHCAQAYSATPWWYAACWGGSINGGGDAYGAGYFNGAYWMGTVKAWGSVDGNGAGNGWIYVR